MPLLKSLNELVLLASSFQDPDCIWCYVRWAHNITGMREIRHLSVQTFWFKGLQLLQVSHITIYPHPHNHYHSLALFTIFVVQVLIPTCLYSFFLLSLHSHNHDHLPPLLSIVIVVIIVIISDSHSSDSAFEGMLTLWLSTTWFLRMSNVRYRIIYKSGRFFKNCNTQLKIKVPYSLTTHYKLVF